MVERLAIAPRVVDALVAPNLTLVAKGGGGAAMDDRVQGSGAVTVTESSNTYTRADMLYQLSPLLAQILYVATQSARNQVYVECIQALPESVQHGIMLELEGVVASVVGDVRLVVTDLLMRFSLCCAPLYCQRLPFANIPPGHPTGAVSRAPPVERRII